MKLEHGKRTMHSRLAIWTVTLGLFTMTATANLEVPLYPVYAREADAGVGVSSLAFAAYLMGALPVLAGLSGLAARIGNKRTFLIAMGCACTANLLMTLSPHLRTLFFARVLQGVCIGLGMGASTAYLVGLRSAAGGRAMAVAPLVAIASSLGFGSGALLTSLALFRERSTVPVSLPAMSALSCAILVFSFFLPRDRGWSADTARRLKVFRPPTFPPGSLLCGLTIATSWSATGITLAIVPAQLAAHGADRLSGVAQFFVNASGAFIYPYAKRFAPLTAMRVGVVLLCAGMALLVAGALSGWLPALFAGAVAAGCAAYGFCYLGSLARVTALGGTEPARSIGGYLLLAYGGLGLPSVAVGFVSDALGIGTGLVAYTVALALACCALYVAAGRADQMQ